MKGLGGSEFGHVTLSHYCTLFSALTRAPGPMWSATTRNRAPHKPLLLLAVMDLVARDVLTSRLVSITGELVELNELFTDYWRSIVPVTRTSSIAFPFSRLHREPFWKLVPLPGREITGAIVDSIGTVSQLRNAALGAEIDEALFVHMASAAGRQAHRDVGGAHRAATTTFATAWLCASCAIGGSTRPVKFNSTPGALCACPTCREMDRALWPGQGHLGWHRTVFRL